MSDALAWGEALSKLGDGAGYVALSGDNRITLDGTFDIDDLAAFVDAWRREPKRTPISDIVLTELYVDGRNTDSRHQMMLENR
jgi:hypothetical protein